MQERLELWDEHPEPRQIIDGFEFEKKREHSRRPFHNPQTTWDRLIRVQLVAEGRVATDDEIASFKEKEWARKPAQNCLLELQPLPCPNLSSWPHDEWTDHRDFRSRSRCKERFIEHRTSKLQDLVKEYKQPKCVVLYSMNKKRQKHWEAIIGEELCSWESCESDGFEAKFLRRLPTLFAVIHHPNDRPTPPNAYFDWVGKVIKTRLRYCSAS